MPPLRRLLAALRPPGAGLPLLLGAVFLLTGLGWAQLLDWDENIYAEVARQMVQRGEYVAPVLNGHPFVEKPPLVLWEMAAAFHLLGVNEVAARLPSALGGVALLAFLVWAGRRLVDAPLGWAWALVYGSTLIPLVFGRSAVIDHTFNGLMAAGAFLLLLYDRARERFLTGGAPRRTHWALLGAASVAMGLAVLAKGPLGGVVPLVAFGGAKLVRRRPGIHPGHFAFCAALSLAVGLSWYAANFLRAGEAFLEGFARFQGLLLSRPLEGHRGPFWYHFGAVLVGFFPWTPLLLLYALRDVRRALWADRATRELLALCGAWLAFVLVLFSFVQTKLPHYSSSAYLPLALLAALALERLRRQGRAVPRWAAVLLAGYGALVGGLVLALPAFAERLAADAGAALEHPPQLSPWAFLPGAALVLGTAVGALWLARGRLRPGAVAVAVAAGLFVVGLWRFHLPLVVAYNQGPVLTLMRQAYATGGDLVLYRHVSFAVLFYGGRDVEMLHTYKFPGDPGLLDAPGPRPRYVISPRAEVERLRREHPRVAPVRELGRLALLRLPARDEAP